MDPRERFKRALAERAHRELIATGWDAFLFDGALKDVRTETGVSETEARIALKALEEQFMLRDGGRHDHFRATPYLALLHEEHDRASAYAENEVRRVVLKEIARVDEGGGSVCFTADDEQLGYSLARLRAAARVLDAVSYIELSGETNGSFHCSIRSQGHELLEDEATIRAALPVTVGEDEASLPAVAPDVLKQLILSCEELLEKRGWTNALHELGEGDRQYAKAEWVNAVREYYSSLESGLKYALHSGADRSEDDALRVLAKTAAARGLIPTNYQALFGFPSSIRSPRSHGVGPKPEPVEVNQPEALLMGNVTRALLVYLASRSSGTSSASGRE